MTKEEKAASKEREYELKEEVRKIARELVDIQTRLYDKGLIQTAHALNKASGELGWEAAEWIEKQMKERKK